MSVNATAQESLPTQVQQVAITQQLGPFVKVHKASLLKIISTIVLGVLCLVLGGFSLYGVIVAVPEAPAGAVVLGVIGLALLAGLVFEARRFVNFVGLKIYFFQRGIIIEHKRQFQAFPWSQTADIVLNSIGYTYRGRFNSLIHIYKLRREDGYQITLDANLMKDMDELDEALAAGIVAEHLPRALHSIEAGQSVVFAPFTLNKQGISNEREFLPWSQIGYIDLDGGVVTIYKQGESRSTWAIRAGKMSHVFVFVAAVKAMLRQTKDSARRKI